MLFPVHEIDLLSEVEEVKLKLHQCIIIMRIHSGYFMVAWIVDLQVIPSSNIQYFLYHLIKTQFILNRPISFVEAF